MSPQSCHERRACALLHFGCGYGGKRGKTQLVYAVFSVAGGCPVAIQAYPGNTADKSAKAY